MSNFIFGEEKEIERYQGISYIDVPLCFYDFTKFVGKTNNIFTVGSLTSSGYIRLDYSSTKNSASIFIGSNDFEKIKFIKLNNKINLLIYNVTGEAKNTLCVGLNKRATNSSYTGRNTDLTIRTDSYSIFDLLPSEQAISTNGARISAIKWCVNTCTKEWVITFEVEADKDTKGDKAIKRSYTYMGVLMDGQINIITPNGGIVDPEGNDLGYTALYNFGGQSSPLITNQMSMVSMIRRHNALYTLTEDINDFNLAVCYPERETIMNFSDKATGNEYILIPRTNVGKSGIVMMEGGSYA